MDNRRVAALALTTVFSIAGNQSYAYIDPEPSLLIDDSMMPQVVPDHDISQDQSDFSPINGVDIYYRLKNDFKISNTEFALWLGVKRRTLYNWLNDPERSTKFGPQIETRLSQLKNLSSAMEPEHLHLLFKIAFSPVFGDQNFGKNILEGKNDQILINDYNILFSKFETLRKHERKRS